MPDPIKFEWTGDLDDDCTCRVGDLTGRAECMGQIKVDWGKGEKPRREELDYWYCAVYRQVGDQWAAEQLFHEGDYPGTILGGDMARGICESVMRAYLTNPTPAREAGESEQDDEQ